MKQPIRMVALRTIAHSDRHNILTAYSRELGRIAFAINAGNGKEASRRRALLMPLSIVECIADIKPGRDIHMLFEPRNVVPLTSLRANPIKSSLAMFIAEVLSVVLHEGPADSYMFQFIEQSIMTLEAIPKGHLGNFHICFLMNLGSFLGIQPDADSYAAGMVFDMHDGTFRITAPLHRHYLEGEAAAIVASLCRINYANMHNFRFTRQQRAQVLDTILQYYSLHHTGMNSLKSLTVLRDLF